MADADILKELRERYDYAKNGWQEIQDEAATDMRFVAGNPWTDEDLKHRKDRPTVAPEEMGQYFNQVINQIRMNPRGMRFMPKGNGADQKGARFYQNKARETEYRSKAKIAYIAAAENAIQRSYGYVRVDVRYASPRDPNQEIWIDGFPDPDMVLPDPDALMPDLSDQQFCFVRMWEDQQEVKRKYGDDIARQNFSDFASTYPQWVQGNKILLAEYWAITTRPRQLVLVQPTAPAQQRMIAPSPTPVAQPITRFKDELGSGERILRDLRKVDYPQVKKYLTNGIELIGEPVDWPGKYIPIVGCFGKIVYVPEGGMVKKSILSMTRFGRDPWKSYCFACSQELEVLGLVPKVSLLAAKGQFDPAQKQALLRSFHEPTALIEYETTMDSGQPAPPPAPLVYPVGEHLQSLEIVKEGFRRAIQAAMGSNFLPTEAQKRNDKSGVALDKIDQAASTGTFHFIDHFDGLVQQVGVIFEDLCDKVHDYRGQTSIIEADDQAQMVSINDPNDPESYQTKGDYACTVSTGPSSDSEQEAVADFIDTSLLGNVQNIEPIVGPKVMAAVLAKAIRMRNLGPQGDQLAELIEPPEFKTQDGQPPNPQLMAAQAQIQQLTQKLQQTEQMLQGKVAEKQTEMQGKMAIAKMQADATSQDKAADREVKLVVAELGAKVDRMALLLEASHKIGVSLDGERARAAEGQQAIHQRAHETVQAARDQLHSHLSDEMNHQRDLELATHQAALQPPPEAMAPDAGAGAGA